MVEYKKKNYIGMAGEQLYKVAMMWMDRVRFEMERMFVQVRRV